MFVFYSIHYMTFRSLKVHFTIEGNGYWKTTHCISKFLVKKTEHNFKLSFTIELNHQVYFVTEATCAFIGGVGVKMTFLEHYLDMFWCHLLHRLILVLHMITIICTMFLDSYKWLVIFDVCICKVYINVVKVCVKCHLGFTAAFVLLIATEFVYEVLILIVDLNHQNR